MVVTSEHNRAHFSLAHHIVEFQCYLQASHSVLIEDAGLCAHYKGVLLRVADPHPVVHVLTAALLGNAVHGGLVGLYEVFVFSTQAHPAERSVAVVEEHRAHYVFHIRRPDETVFLIHSVL